MKIGGHRITGSLSTLLKWCAFFYIYSLLFYCPQLLILYLRHVSGCHTLLASRMIGPLITWHSNFSRIHGALKGLRSLGVPRVNMRGKLLPLTPPPHHPTLPVTVQTAWMRLNLFLQIFDTLLSTT